jgi:predicted ATPase
MAIRSSSSWPVEQLRQETTSAIFRDAATGAWTTQRAELHEKIINRLFAGKRREASPRMWVVTGGVGSGKSTLIKSELAPEHPGAVVIDADQMWVEIPEYEALAAADWRTAGDRTYAELRYLRDAALAEAAARRLDIILEISGDENSAEVANILKRDGYELSVNYVNCSPEQAQERMLKRANTEPTPEDNLWCSLPLPEFPDKYDYQDVDPEIFRQEYAKRRGRAQGSDEGLR